MALALPHYVCGWLYSLVPLTYTFGHLWNLDINKNVSRSPIKVVSDGVTTPIKSSSSELISSINYPTTHGWCLSARETHG